MRLLRKNSNNEKIFINYRRGDAGGFAGRLADSLAAYFGRDRIFRDVTGIDYGHDFEQVIDQKLSESGAVIVLIGEQWATQKDADGNRRLDNPEDYVSREIHAALESSLPVFPVLIGDAVMPRIDDLPEKLNPLTRHNAMTITDERWAFDVNRLAKVLAIDVPGSVAQRMLDMMRAAALGLLFVSGVLTTIVFCLAVNGILGAPAQTPDVAAVEASALVAAGGIKNVFTPLASAVPFIAILLAGTIALVSGSAMEPENRKYAWTATAVAYVGTLLSFIHYGLYNEAMGSWSLLVNFGAAVVLTFTVLCLICLAGFRAK